MQIKFTKHFLSILAITIFANLAYPIVIVPPIVYFASLSIGAFLANSLIALFALAAVAGAANWKIFNKPFPHIISAGFGFASTVFLGISSMLVAALLFSPRNLEQIIAAAAAVFAISSVLFFLRSYREFRANPQSMAKHMMPVFAVSMFFALLFIPCVFSAIEFRQMQMPKAQGAPQENAQQSGMPQASAQQEGINPAQSESVLPFLPSAQKAQAPPLAAKEEQLAQNGMGQANAQNSAFQASNAQASKVQTQLLFWLMPQSAESCIIEIGSQKQEYLPKKECVYESSPAAKLEFCPIEISVPSGCENDLNVISSGSCQDKLTLICKGSNLQLPN